MNDDGGTSIDASKLTKIGEIKSIFTKIRVIGVHTEVEFKKGSTILIQGPDGSRQCNFYADSIEIDHIQQNVVGPGSDCGIELDCSRRTLPLSGDIVYLISSPSDESKYEDPLDGPQITEKGENCE